MGHGAWGKGRSGEGSRLLRRLGEEAEHARTGQESAVAFDHAAVGVEEEQRGNRRDLVASREDGVAVGVHEDRHVLRRRPRGPRPDRARRRASSPRTAGTSRRRRRRGRVCWTRGPRRARRRSRCATRWRTPAPSTATREYQPLSMGHWTKTTTARSVIQATGSRRFQTIRSALRIGVSVCAWRGCLWHRNDSTRIGLRSPSSGDSPAPGKVTRHGRASAVLDCHISAGCFDQPLGRPKRGHRCLLRLAPCAPPDKAPCDPAEAIRPASIEGDEPEARAPRRIGKERPQFEARPEVVARVQHL